MLKMLGMNPNTFRSHSLIPKSNHQGIHESVHAMIGNRQPRSNEHQSILSDGTEAWTAWDMLSYLQ